jgi:hypothetical protein
MASPSKRSKTPKSKSKRASRAKAALRDRLHPKHLHAAIRNLTAAVSAAKPHKTPDEIIADATDCMSGWLMRAKRVSRPDSMNPSKNMTSDFHIGAPQEMQLCLEWVQHCLSTKGDFYNLDTTSPNANKHLIKLMSGTLGDVVADIASHTS